MVWARAVDKTAPKAAMVQLAVAHNADRMQEKEQNPEQKVKVERHREEHQKQSQWAEEQQPQEASATCQEAAAEKLSVGIVPSFA